MFTPGAGMTPPVLAGREHEKAVITEALEDLGDRFNPTANIALIGPRGNGKTALLRWVEAHVDKYKGNIKCAILNPDCFSSHSDLVGALADQRMFAALLGDMHLAIANLLRSGNDPSRQRAAKKLLSLVMRERCSDSGLVILIDEAHTLDRNPDIARTFFKDAQSLVGDGGPLLIILAGTPAASSRLNGIECAFWNRLNKLGIGRLDATASQEAIRIPLERMGYCIEADTLDQAANAAQCYPYFLQVVGRALHRSAKAEPDKLSSGNRIGDAILERALKAFWVARNTYYADRRRELRTSGILASAEAVARLFVGQKKKTISTTAIKAALVRSIDGKLEETARINGRNEPALWVEHKLRNVGFIWSQFGNENRCEPGIPSLMNYVVERAN